MAKSLAGGFPMGAVACSEKVNVPTMTHGTIFGGNPLGCAAANAAITFMQEENLAQRAEELGTYMLQRLKNIKSQRVREVRGVGLMIGVELREKPAAVLQALVQKRVLAMPAGTTVVRFLSPLIVSREQIDTAVIAFEEVLRD